MFLLFHLLFHSPITGTVCKATGSLMEIFLKPDFLGCFREVCNHHDKKTLINMLLCTSTSQTKKYWLKSNSLSLTLGKQHFIPGKPFEANPKLNNLSNYFWYLATKRKHFQHVTAAHKIVLPQLWTRVLLFLSCPWVHAKTTGTLGMRFGLKHAQVRYWKHVRIMHLAGLYADSVISCPKKKAPECNLSVIFYMILALLFKR